MDRTERRLEWFRVLVLVVLAMGVAAMAHGADDCAHVNTTCQGKACCATDGNGVPLYCDERTVTCKRVGLTTSTVRPATTTTTLAAGCVEAGLLCGQKGRPETFRPCCDPAFECRQAEQSGGATGHAMCLLRETATTTTTLPPPSGLAPERYGPADVGLAYYDSSQDINYHPRTGAWASQYTKAARIDHQLLVELPRVIRALRDLGCAVPSPNTVQDNVGKFLFSYSIRPVASGQPYSYRANYLVDRWRRTVEQFRACLKGDRGVAFLAANPWARDLMGLGVTRVEPLEKVDKSHANDGTLTCRNPFPPLTSHQCGKLHDAHAAHEAHAKCLLDRRPAAECDALAARVRPTQLAFEGTARTPAEQQLMLLVFTGDIDPQHSPERVDHHTRQTSAQHHRWASAFRCGTGAPPDCLEVLKGRWGHARSHFLRAVKGYYLREVCDTPGKPKANMDNCLVSED